MADLNLTLGAPSGDRTLSSTPGNVRRVRLPAGTRAFVITSESAFYLEEDSAQTKADETTSVSTNRQKYAAGTYGITPIGAGRGSQELTATRYIYVVGTVADQPYWITAVHERGT